MEQKTETSPTVDARCEQVSRLLTVGGMMSNVMYNLGQCDGPDAKQFKELCAKWDAAAHAALDLRAALKAQPAPTEAQGEDSARLECLNMLINSGAKAWPRSCLRCGLGPCQTGTDRARASAETGGVKP